MEETKTYNVEEYNYTKKLYWITFLLGWCGVHRFYQRKIGTGILYFCTFGLFAIGWLVDGLIIAVKYQKLLDQKNGTKRKMSKDEIQYIRQEYYRKKANERSCPKCGGKRFHAFIEDKEIISGKSKTKYTANLNPLKPFTILNKKEKVVRKPVTIQVSKFVCDDCGNIFN